LVIAAVAVLASLAAVAGRAHADPAEVESLIAQGNQLRREGQPGRALPFFQKAHELARTPRTEAQLGLAELAAGYYLEAEQHLAAALELPKHPFVASNKAPLAKALADARAQIGEVVVEGEPPGAAVKVNGRAVGVLPLAAPIRMSAGRADIELTADGHKTGARSVVVRGRERQRVTMSLEKLPAVAPVAPVAPQAAVAAPVTAAVTPPAAPPVTSPNEATAPPMLVTAPEAPPSRSRLRVAAWIVGGAAIVALGAGVGFNLASLSNEESFSRSCYREGNQIFLRPNNQPPVMIESCTSYYNAWETDMYVSIASYITGGALAVTSAILFWRSSVPAASTQAHLSCTPSLSGIVCGGRF
jgi:hypothetical protein